MREALFYQQQEAKIVSLAAMRFAAELSIAERDMLHDSVRPGSDPKPKDASGTPLAVARRTVRGGLLRWLVTDGEASALVDPNGVSVVSAIVLSEVDLSDCRATFALTFSGCLLEDAVYFSGGSFRNINFEDCQFRRALDATNATVSGTFTLYRCRCRGTMTLDNIEIANDLILTVSEFDATISIKGARLGGSLNLKGSQLHCKDVALVLDVSQIGGELYITDYSEHAGTRGIAFECAGDIHAPHLTVGQDIHASYARFSKKGGAIDFGAASLKSGSAYFDNVHTDASLSFYEAKISDGVTLQTAQSTFLGSAVNLREIVVSGALNLHGFQGQGSINMYGGLIDGDFVLSDAVLSDLDLRNVHVTRDISAAKVCFTGSDQSFYASDVRVDGQIDLNYASTVAWVYLARCTIGHDLSLRGATVVRPQGREAVYLEEVIVEGGIFISKGFRTEGNITITGGSAGGNVSAMYARMGTFILKGAQIGGSIRWIGVKQATAAGLYLYQTKAASLEDDRSSWPKPDRLGVVGLRYETLVLRKVPTAEETIQFLEPDEARQSAEDRIAWLKLQESEDVAASQPWQQLAVFFASRGDEGSSKKVLHMMARVQGYSRGLVGRAVSAPYDWVAEDPLHITLPIVGLWLAGSLIFWRARRIDAMSPREKDAYAHFVAKEPISEYMPFSPLIYTLENVLPVVHFGQDQAWGPNPAIVQSPPLVGWRRFVPRIDYGWLARLRWVLIVLGWVLTLILAGAIGSRFKG